MATLLRRAPDLRLRPRCLTALSVLLLSALLLLAAPAAAGKPARCQGQTVYVPAYSEIYHGVKTRPFLLTVTLSVRNADPAVRIVISEVQLLDAKGKVVRSFPAAQRAVGPFEAAEAVIDERDPVGGSGGGFLVRWSSDAPAVPPVVQSVMIGSSNSQGISFLSEGRVIEER